MAHARPPPCIEVERVQRSDRGAPRFEWGGDERRAWAVAMGGPQGMTPSGALEPVGEDFAALVSAVRAHMQPRLFVGSAIELDFDARRGHACGRFAVLGVRAGQVVIVHDPSVLRAIVAQAPDAPPTEQMRALYGPMLVSFIGEQGLVVADGSFTPIVDDPIAACAFSFADCEALLVCSSTVHESWPRLPASLEEAATLARARSVRDDGLLMRWPRRA